MSARTSLCGRSSGREAVLRKTPRFAPVEDQQFVFQVRSD
jgi:hypothetical protein